MQGSDGKHMVLQGLDNSVKNFLTSVPLVADLRSPAMRDRHWTQLMTTTKVSTAGRSRHYSCCRFELWLGCLQIMRLKHSCQPMPAFSTSALWPSCAWSPQADIATEHSRLTFHACQRYPAGAIHH